MSALVPFRAPSISGLRRPCPDDAAEMLSTGNLFLDPRHGRWYVEWYCPEDGELRQIWREETQVLVEAAADRAPLT